MTYKYYKQLDGVRGIAALMIIFFHFFKTYLYPNHNKAFIMASKLSHFGQTGVTLFFVLSGFLITRILLFSKNSDNYFKSFYIRRSLRIFPLFYLFLLLYYFIVPLIIHAPIVPFGKQWTFWFYLQNFAITFNWNQIGPNHLWSLAVEEHFYLFWPLLIYFLNPKQIKNAVLIIFLISLVCRLVLQYYNYGVFYFTFTNIDALALGSLLSIDELSGFPKNSFYVKLFIVTIIPTIVLWFFVGTNGNSYIQLIKLPLTAVIYYAFIGMVISTGTSNKFSILLKVLKSKFLSYSGKVSYGLYIYHPFIFTLYFDNIHTKSVWINLLSCLALTFITASLSFYFFESPILRLKKYFEYKKGASSLQGHEIQVKA